MSTDFNGLLKIGLESALLAKKARSEVKQVFLDLNKSLAEETENKVELIIKKLRKRNAFLALSASLILSGNNEVDSEHFYYGLVVKHINDDKNNTEVAQWRESDKGYPCWVVYNDSEYACMDKESLISALGDLVSKPHFGEAVLKVIDNN